MPPRRKPDLSIPAEHVQAAAEGGVPRIESVVVGEPIQATQLVYDPEVTYDVELVEYSIDMVPGSKSHEQDGRRAAAKEALKALLNDGYHIASSTAGDARSGGAVVVWTLVRAEGL